MHPEKGFRLRLSWTEFTSLLVKYSADAGVLF